MGKELRQLLGDEDSDVIRKPISSLPRLVKRLLVKNPHSKKRLPLTRAENAFFSLLHDGTAEAQHNGLDD